MLVPSLLEHVRVKDNSEIFRVVAFNLASHTADLIRPGMDVIYHDVPWAMLEAVGDDWATLAGPADPASSGSSGEPAATKMFSFLSAFGEYFFVSSIPALVGVGLIP
jgi:hypothetical protein